MIHDKCRVCRRLGQKLFLKGDRCLSAKCALVKRAYPPGPERKRKSRAFSEYKRSLTEKQKLRNWYGLSEKQFKRYVKDVLSKRGKIQDIANELIKRLEQRLDSVVLRLGFAKSRVQARQMVTHGAFMVNKKAVNIPSYVVLKGDEVAVKENKKKKGMFKDFKKNVTVSWLELDATTMIATMKDDPTITEVMPPAEISTIFEFYSR